MPPAFFDHIEECMHHSVKKSVTNFRNPLGVGPNLAITLRHLATGETYTSLQYYWLVGQTTILAEFQDKYLYCPTSPDEWKRVEEKFKTRWNVAQAPGSLYGKQDFLAKVI